MSTLSEFQEKFRTGDLEIASSDHWTWTLRPLQPTIGAGILSLKREEEAFSGITEDEGKDLSSILKVIENTLRSTFGNEKINYLMLMMVDKQVHFHIIPRYSSTISFSGRDWKDASWPKPPVLDADPLSAEVMTELLAFLRQRVTVSV